MIAVGIFLVIVIVGLWFFYTRVDLAPEDAFRVVGNLGQTAKETDLTVEIDVDGWVYLSQGDDGDCVSIAPDDVYELCSLLGKALATHHGS